MTPQQLAAAELGPLDDCPLCVVKTGSMCAHIGIHIFGVSHGIKETLKEEVCVKVFFASKAYQFSGLSRIPMRILWSIYRDECKIQIKVSNKGSVSLETRCP